MMASVDQAAKLELWSSSVPEEIGSEIRGDAYHRQGSCVSLFALTSQESTYRPSILLKTSVNMVPFIPSSSLLSLIEGQLLPEDLNLS